MFIVFSSLASCFKVGMNEYIIMQKFRGAYGVMDTVNRVQIQDESDCISYNSNTLGKCMNPIIRPPAIGK